ncbi:MAG: DUF1893 domain-containing protein [Clostridia bacterium]
MGDLERARHLLMAGTYTCVLCKGDLLYTSTARGVRPVLDWITTGQDLSGFSAADKVVGKAAALLFVRAGIAHLYARVISEPALAVLRAREVPVEYGRVVPGIINRAGDGPCPMESAVSGTDDPDEALRLIRKKMEELTWA